MRSFDLSPGAPVIVHLHSPKEKLWGLLVSLSPAGIVVHGLDLEAFEDWMRQEIRREEGVCPGTHFFPLTRVVRMDRDDSSPGLPGCADRFHVATGRTVFEVTGYPLPRSAAASCPIPQEEA
jgi:hypothetical protein